jgi:hypothetical protein
MLLLFGGPGRTLPALSSFVGGVADEDPLAGRVLVLDRNSWLAHTDPFIILFGVGKKDGFILYSFAPVDVLLLGKKNKNGGAAVALLVVGVVLRTLLLLLVGWLIVAAALHHVCCINVPAHSSAFP